MTNYDDEYWMRLCLALAERGAGGVSPNPMVGCVIAKGGRKIAEGWHRQFGGPHAEIDALKKAGSRARGATLYVNLEPCSHWGKTPPCAEAIIKAGIKRVVAAIKDPNPLVKGKGLARLQHHGISVASGFLEAEAMHLNRAFLKWIRTGRPYVTIKTAMTLDGKICTRTGESRWISSSDSRKWVHRLRARADAVAVGAQTALRDNPRLTTHGWGRNPLRIVIDSRLILKPSARIFNGEAPTILATTGKISPAQIETFKRRGVGIIACTREKNGRVNLKELLKTMGKMFISHLVVEGGGTLNASFLENNLVDELFVFVAPKIFGGRDAKTFVEGEGISSPARARNLKWDTFRHIGPDLLLRAVPV